MEHTPAAPVRAIVVSAADARFFFLLDELFASIAAAADAPTVALGCLDLGLEPAQVADLQARGVEVVTPRTGLEAGALADDASKLGYLARPFLPEAFPGHDVYVWMDADAWIQGGAALSGLIEAAQAGGAALVREDDPAYRSNFGLLLWKGKHYLLGYGPWRAARLLPRRQVNNGVFAMRADAPHWAVWRRLYQQALTRTGLAAPHDQFALNAAAYLHGLKTTFLPATFNWICDLARPWWDDEAQAYCTPDASRRPIRVMHLAGPIKTTEFDVRTPAGGVLRGRLRYGVALRAPDDEPAPAGGEAAR